MRLLGSELTLCQQEQYESNLAKRTSHRATRKTLISDPLVSLRSKLTCCSICHPQCLKDLLSIENVQRWASKFILLDYIIQACYKSRLLTLHLLLLMMQFKLIDILFSIKSPTQQFNIFQHVSFSTASMWSSKCILVHNLSRTNRDKHFYCLVCGIHYQLLT